LEQARTQRRKAEMDLNLVLGLEATNSLNVQNEIQTVLAGPSLQDWDKRSREHPEFRELETSIQSLGQDTRLARSEFYPQISAYYRLSKTLPETSADVNNREVGVTLQWNIFDGFSSLNRTRRARALESSLSIKRDYIRRQIVVKMQQNFLDFDLARRQVPVALRTLQAARDRVATVTEQYKVGLRSYLEWEQAQTKLTAAEKDYLATQGKALDALAEAEFAQGLTLEDK
jgi:outer membrane protein TolC